MYAKANGGAFDFLIDSARQGAVPIDPTFWDALFAQPAAAWGLRVYEQVCSECVMGSRMRLQLLNATTCCAHLMCARKCPCRSVSSCTSVLFDFCLLCIFVFIICCALIAPAILFTGLAV